MIENTFCHIKEIGPKVEQQLWNLNIYDWASFNLATDIPLPKRKLSIVSNGLRESVEALKCHNHRYFSNGLQSNLHWRLFREFQCKSAYIDIETTGLFPSTDIITTIALYDGQNIKYYVNGKNLDEFKLDIQNYALLITYNGKCFDIPFIKSFFKITLDQSQIDLRYLLQSLGYKGGLKECEKQFGISRNELEDIDGFFAVQLWNEYKKENNERALDTLLAYNIEDVVNLEYLMCMAYNLKLKGTPFEHSLHLNIPERPKTPFFPDTKLIKRMQENMFGSLVMRL